MKDDKHLIHRLNRVQGQIEAIRKRLIAQDETDCIETLRLVKAANSALKKFGEAYVSQHLKDCVRSGASKQELEEGLQEVITSAFYL